MNDLPGISISYSLDSTPPRVEWTSRDGYPLTKLPLDSGYALIEGCIYNRTIDELSDELNALAPAADMAAIEQKVLSWDGEYVLVSVNQESNEVVVINDYLGRLPVYVMKTESRMIITRNFGEIPRESLTEDRIARAFGLLFGYPIGNRTIWNEVSKIPGNTQIRINPTWSEAPVTIHSGEQMFFDSRCAAEGNSLKLLEELKTGLRNRLNHFPNLALSLSGGLDSRLIAGILADMDVPIPVVTYKAPTGHPEDKNCAQEITARLGWKAHEVVELRATTPQEAEQLFQLKGGQNFLAMGYIVPFLQHFDERHYAMLTGDGGDKTIECIHPMRSIRTIEHLWSYVVSAHGIIPFSTIETLCGVKESELKAHFLKLVNHYPEQKLDDKYARFVLTERGFNWLFEGEDRNRKLIWSTTPFYALPFFLDAVKIQPDKKREGRLFRALFAYLPGKLGDVVNPNWKVALNDQHGVRKLMWRQRIKSFLPSFMKSALGQQKEKWYTYKDWLTHHDLPCTAHANPSIDEAIHLTDRGWWTVYTQLKQLNPK